MWWWCSVVLVMSPVAVGLTRWLDSGVKLVRVVLCEPGFICFELVLWHRALMVVPVVLRIHCTFVRRCQCQVVVFVAAMLHVRVRSSDVHIWKVVSEHTYLLVSGVVEEFIEAPHECVTSIPMSNLQNSNEGAL